MNNTVRGAVAVAEFEGRRAATWGRLALWGVLTAFPVAITTLVCLLAKDNGPQNRIVWGILIFGLTQITTVLGVLLWASPVIQLELESRTWIYSASRPYGRRSLLLGRYAVAVAWSGASGIVASLVCCLIARPMPLGPAAAAPACATVLSAVAFSSLYCLIAVAAPNRSMAIAFAFTMIVEVLVAFVPRNISQFTIQFRLRSLMVRWLGIDRQFLQAEQLFSDSSSLQHVLILILYASATLLAAVWILERRELATSDE